MLQAALGHQLHADADAQERRAAAGRGLDRLAHAGDGGEAGGAVGEGALAGQHDTVGGGDDGRIGGDGDVASMPARSAASASAREADARLPLP